MFFVFLSLITFFFFFLIKPYMDLYLYLHMKPMCRVPLHKNLHHCKCPWYFPLALKVPPPVWRLSPCRKVILDLSYSLCMCPVFSMEQDPWISWIRIFWIRKLRIYPGDLLSFFTVCELYGLLRSACSLTKSKNSAYFDRLCSLVSSKCCGISFNLKVKWRSFYCQP